MDMGKRDSRALMVYQLQNYLFVITVAENFQRLYFIEGLARLILLVSGPPLLAVRTSSQLESSGFFLDSSTLNSLLGFLKKKCPHLLQAISCNTMVASLFLEDLTIRSNEDVSSDFFPKYQSKEASYSYFSLFSGNVDCVNIIASSCLSNHSGVTTFCMKVCMRFRSAVKDKGHVSSFPIPCCFPRLFLWHTKMKARIS